MYIVICDAIQKWLQFSFPMRLINAKVVYTCMCALATFDLMVLQLASRGHHFPIHSAGLMLMQFSKGGYVKKERISVFKYIMKIMHLDFKTDSEFALCT